MAATISPVLRRIKSDLAQFLPDVMVLDACRQVGHVWRRRQLDPVPTLHLFILQVLHFNTALTHLRHTPSIFFLLFSRSGAIRTAPGGAQ
ncbi:MAG: hypothetical protein ACREIT_01400 [Tepidisphaeraceae bacterium]